MLGSVGHSKSRFTQADGEWVAGELERGSGTPSCCTVTTLEATSGTDERGRSRETTFEAM